MIDAGCSKEWPKLVAGLETVGLGPKDVEAVLVTHAHADHIGFGREAAKNGLRVEVHRDEETRALGAYEGKAAARPTQLPLWNPAVWRSFVALLKEGILKHPALDSVETFQDGDVLDLPGKPRVVHAPGHTEGHCAFLMGDRRVLFSGDALVTQNLVGKHNDEPQIMQDYFHNDPTLNRESLARLRSVDADLILPGHGVPFHGTPAEAVDKALGIRS